MSPAAVVRAARRSDLDAVVQLALQAAADSHRDSWRKSLIEDLDMADRYLAVADREGETVGYGRARRFVPDSPSPDDTAPDGYYLLGLFVQPRARRTGIGAALVEARLGWIGERADEAWFFSNARNTGSIRLHARFGFEEVTRRFSFPRVTFDGGEGILFRARLR